MRTPKTKPMIMDVMAVRNVLSRSVMGVPTDLLDRALRVTGEALDATDVRLATQRGKFTDKHEVVDHKTRLAAAEQIYQITNLITRGQDRDPDENAVSMEVDSKTGIVRIVVGGRRSPSLGGDATTHTPLNTSCDAAISGVDENQVAFGFMNEASLERVSPPLVMDERNLVSQGLSEYNQKSELGSRPEMKDHMRIKRLILDELVDAD